MSRKVVGVDLGGTKLLAGVVDEQLGVRDRVHKMVTGLSEHDLVETITKAFRSGTRRLVTTQLHGLLYITVRAGVLPVAAARRASPFGSVVTGSLGLPSGLPFAEWRAGFPDMSRFPPSLAGRQGKLYLPDKEFRSEPYLIA